MVSMLERCWRFLRPPAYQRRPPLVLINGLAEQPESWFLNRRYWEDFFDVKMPEFLVYDGVGLQRRIEDGLPISVEYLTDQLELYLDSFVQHPPYHLVASSLGCQVAVEYAIRRPETVNRIVLLCPSGFGGEEKLPMVEGVRKNDFGGLIGSVFFDRRHVRPAMVGHYERQFASKAWKKGILRTIRGTCEHSVRDKLPLVQQPSLLICGREDRIIDSKIAEDAVRNLSHFRFVSLPRCGHAPQIENANVVNRMVCEFLHEPMPTRRSIPSPRTAPTEAALQRDAALAEPSYA